MFTAAALACVALCPPAARAQQPGAQLPGQPVSLRDMLFGAQRRDDRSTVLPPVARYRGEMGAGFTFERPVAGPALLKFEDSPEVWVLRPTPGPRGDVIYRDDVGQPMLRATRVGGLTLFTETRPDGMAAWMAGTAAQLRPTFQPTPSQLYQIMLQASTRASTAARHLVLFEAPDVSPAGAQVFADAVVVTGEAFLKIAGRGRAARAVLTRFSRVLFVEGRAPQATVAGQEVRIVIAPRDGLAGRPSSHRIALVISER